MCHPVLLQIIDLPLVRIMRSGRVPQVIRPAVPAGTVEHPYLRTMQHRGGGYAILRALWDAEKSPNYEGDLVAMEKKRVLKFLVNMVVVASWF